jgi:hypothetical protein
VDKPSPKKKKKPSKTYTEAVARPPQITQTGRTSKAPPKIVLQATSSTGAKVLKGGTVAELSTL